MKRRQWPWYVLQTVAFATGFAGWAVYIDPANGPSIAAFISGGVVAALTTLVVSKLLDLFSFLFLAPPRLVADKDQPPSQDLRFPRPSRPTGDIPQQTPSLRVGKDIR